MKKPGKTKAKTTDSMEVQQQEENMDLAESGFSSTSDICQQLMDRYAKSSAVQHRHLLATAAAMRSILSAESLPLTTPSYFAAAITAVDDACASEALDSNAITALLSFLAIVLPLVPKRGISAPKASEAVAVLVGLVEREREKLAASTLRAVVKSLGILLVGFCDLEDWGSVKLGFDTLLKLSIDKRPKVRRCAQDCLEKIFQSFQCLTIIKGASNSVLLMLRSYLSLADKLSASWIVDESKDETLSKPEHLDVLHMLNVLKLIVPSLHAEVKSELLSELHKRMTPQFSPLTRHILKLIEVFFETSRVDIMPQVESIMITLTSYVSLREKNPVDTIISAANLLKNALDNLHAGESSSGIMNLPRVCESVAGLLSSEPSAAPEASSILKELINRHIDKETFLVDKEQPNEAESEESLRINAIKSTCSVFENLVNASDEIPNEHLLAVISTLFTKLGNTSCNYMENILLKLAALMTSGGGDTSNTEHLQNCIGSAVTAMGPERILTLVPITLNTDDLTSTNIWLVPILKKYVVGASLRCYIEHIDPLANSFYRASHKVIKKVIGKDLQAHAHGLWGLLPAFCHYPTDCYKKFGLLVELLVTYLKKYTFMHENVAVALQILVNQNKSALGSKEDEGEGKTNKVKGSMVEHGTSYSKKIAAKNIRALSSYSAELLQALTNLFIDSIPGKRAHLKDAIGGLASVTDSSVTKNIFMSLLGRYQFLHEKTEPEELENQTDESIDKEQADSCTSEKEIKRSAMIELASSLVEGARVDLIDLIFNFLKQTFKSSNEIGHQDAYHTLNRILEAHAWFCSSRFVELVDLLLGLKSPVEMASLRSRFACFHILIVHALEMDLEDEENTKGFLILNEIILILKDGDEEARKVAYDRLLLIGSSLKKSSSVAEDAPYHKLISMILGYLSGASPHIKSGAVSALSVLIHNDPGICVSEPELVPSILSLLQGKAEEVVKAALGFVKVLVLCLPTKDLQNFLSDIVNRILPWSAVSRNHFRLKVTTILEIVLRKCGSPAVKLVTPERYNNLIKSVLENRQNRGSKEADTADMETTIADTPSERSYEGTQNENGSRESWKRKRESGNTNQSGSKEQWKRRKESGEGNENNRGSWKRRDGQENTANRFGGRSKMGERPRDSNNDRSMKRQSEGIGEKSKRPFKRGPKDNGTPRPSMGRKGNAGGSKPHKFGGKQRK